MLAQRHGRPRHHVGVVVSLNKEQLLSQYQTQLLKKPSKESHLLIGFLPQFVEIFQFLANKSLDVMSLENLQDQIFQDMIRILSPIVLPTLVVEMHLSRNQGVLNANTSEKRFCQFVDFLQDEKFLNKLLDKYPILQQLLQQRKTYYQVMMNELLIRINQDKNSILNMFFSPKTKTFNINKIQFSGDEHNQGRAVAIIYFHNKNKILYKPRSLDIDFTFQQLITWFNEYASQPLLTIKIINKQNYGWCEFIEYKNCQSLEDIKSYYFCFGSLLALCHLVRAHDLHYENVIACGQYPVIVDYECMLKPIIDSNKEPIPNFYITQTGLLPSRLFSNNLTLGLEISPLATKTKQNAIYRSMVWQNAGTCQMKLERVEGYLHPEKNIPKHNGQSIPYQNYITEIEQGFEQSYHLLLKHQDELWGEYRLFYQFKHANTRVLIRPTNEYGKLLEESYHPSLLKSLDKRLAYFAWLRHRFQHKKDYNSLIDSEINDLLQGDIPSFHAKIEDKIIYNSNSQKQHVKVSYSGWELLEFQLKHQLSLLDLQQQKRLLHLTFMADNYTLNKAENIKLKNHHHSIAELQSSALSEAYRQLSFLQQEAFLNKTEFIWPQINKVGMKDKAILKFTNYELYDGIAGIALVFAYGNVIFSNKQFLTLAKKCCDQLINQINRYSLKAITTKTGAFQGVSGFLYCLLCLYKLWHDDSLKNAIYDILAILPELINQDEEIDIMSGNAGCIIVLINLYHQFNDKQILTLIQSCVDRILLLYPHPNQMPKCGKYLNDEKPWLGFSHGTSGILWAFAKCRKILPAQEKIIHWINEALQYEKKHFNDSKQNWPNHMTEKQDSWVSAWCHGAAGIGLSRIDLAESIKLNQVKDDIDIAIQTTLREGFNETFNLCHGNLGNLELLLNSKQSKYQAQLSTILSNCLVYLKNDTACSDGLPLDASPGLMTGRAGIAYQLLRFCYPDIIPSILLLKS